MRGAINVTEDGIVLGLTLDISPIEYLTIKNALREYSESEGDDIERADAKYILEDYNLALFEEVCVDPWRKENKNGSKDMGV